MSGRRGSCRTPRPIRASRRPTAPCRPAGTRGPECARRTRFPIPRSSRPRRRSPLLPRCSRPSAASSPAPVPTNCNVALRPTMISLVPGRNARPSTIRSSSRMSNAAGSTPRSGTFAAVPVVRFGTSTTTNSSAEATGPPSVRCTPAASFTIRALARSSTLLNSVSLPPRITIAVSGDPAPTIAARNPSAIDSTATKTITTPVTPTTATADDPARSGIVRSVSAVTVKICVRKRIGSASAVVHIFRRAFTIWSRVACTPGRMPVRSPRPAASAMPSAQPPGWTLKPWRNPPVGSPARMSR